MKFVAGTWIARLEVVGALAVVLVAGCTARDPVMDTIQASNLRKLASFYTPYVGQHRGRGPADEKEFKTYIQGLPATQLSAMGISDVDKLFTSERDGKPYVIQYFAGAIPPGSGVIGYEQEGKNGKRLVAMGTGQVVEADQAEFQKLVPPAAKR